MPLNPAQWHARYIAQALWTQGLRRHLYQQIDLPSVKSILDVGCGTGVLTSELTGLSQATVCGLDINPLNIGYAQKSSPSALFLLGDANDLPFSTDAFDIALCHFVLLWVKDPVRVLAEMTRVTHPGGAVLALAEPDYGGRIDYPAELALIGEWQQSSLRTQGAEPCMGRRLGTLFHQAGLTSVETGVLGGHWNKTRSRAELESEWTVLQSDLEALFSPEQLVSMQVELARLRHLDLEANQRGNRLLFVPTFYAWGRVPVV
jgi:SAM-dependent methyltransferase